MKKMKQEEHKSLFKKTLLYSGFIGRAGRYRNGHIIAENVSAVDFPLYFSQVLILLLGVVLVPRFTHFIGIRTNPVLQSILGVEKARLKRYLKEVLESA